MAGGRPELGEGVREETNRALAVVTAIAQLRAVAFRMQAGLEDAVRVGAVVASRAGSGLEVRTTCGRVENVARVASSRALSLVSKRAGAPLVAVFLGAEHHLVHIHVKLVALFPVAFDAELG